MAGRFPLYTDADVNGPVVHALVDRAWDVLRDRVMVANDIDVKLLAERWHAEQRAFRGLVWWVREHYGRMSPRDFVEAFEELAQRDDPFAAYPIVHLQPKR